MNNWKVAAASSIGTSHLKLGLPCQDNNRVEILVGERPCLLFALSDGAGSATCSEVGSAIVCSALMALGREFVATNSICNFNEQTANSWLTSIQTAIAEEASANGNAIQQYAATLIFGAVEPEAAAFLQLGDGAIVVSEYGDLLATRRGTT